MLQSLLLYLQQIGRMLSKRQLFLDHVGQTGPMPVMIDVSHAQGMFIYDTEGKRYLDMNSGISVSSLGHCHPAITHAILKQTESYMHTMVYGEHVQSPQVGLASLLAKQLDSSLDAVYFVMSGTEATEGAMKLAKRYTGRTEIISCANAYHGSTHGAESLRSDEKYKQAFYPLLPDVRHITFNDFGDLDKITDKTSCVILEPVQAEAGVRLPEMNYLQALKKRCTETGALMILDEIQTGFGRTGHLFAHQWQEVSPDILLLGKAMGGGMPIAAFVSSKKIMSSLTKNPMLGHITTFGGHPVCCAAAEACLRTLIEEPQIIKEVSRKAIELKSFIESFSIIKEVRHAGLMMAVEVSKRKYLKHIVARCMELGLIVDYFLFDDRSFRLAPPLIISDEEIDMAKGIFKAAFKYAEEKYKK
jgi:acetylornithine/succinyldiaminopimelate/putrescine aminotransferase